MAEPRKRHHATIAVSIRFEPNLHLLLTGRREVRHNPKHRNLPEEGVVYDYQRIRLIDHTATISFFS